MSSIGGDNTSKDLSGSSGNDFISGYGGDDTLDGNAGDDVLRGGDDDDVLLGGIGGDRLFGDGGDDTLSGGDDGDIDYLTGGQGADVFVFGDQTGRDRILDFETGTDTVDLSANTALNGFADVLAAASEVNGHVRIQLGGTNLLYIYDTAIADLSATDFWF